MNFDKVSGSLAWRATSGAYAEPPLPGRGAAYVVMDVLDYPLIDVFGSFYVACEP